MTETIILEFWSPGKHSIWGALNEERGWQVFENFSLLHSGYHFLSPSPVAENWVRWPLIPSVALFVFQKLRLFVSVAAFDCRGPGPETGHCFKPQRLK